MTHKTVQNYLTWWNTSCSAHFSKAKKVCISWTFCVFQYTNSTCIHNDIFRVCRTKGGQIAVENDTKHEWVCLSVTEKKRPCYVLSKRPSYVAKTKALISFAGTAKLICVFVFAYAKSQFSYDEAHIQHSKSDILATLFLGINKPPKGSLPVHVLSAHSSHKGSFNISTTKCTFFGQQLTKALLKSAAEEIGHRKCLHDQISTKEYARRGRGGGGRTWILHLQKAGLRMMLLIMRVSMGYLWNQ